MTIARGCNVFRILAHGMGNMAMNVPSLSFRLAAVSAYKHLYQVQQVRYKNMNKSRRVKVPHVAKEAQKWVRHGEEITKRFSEQKVFPKSFSEKKVLDNVWFPKYYMEQQFSLGDAISMHQEITEPEMFDAGDEMIYMNMRLDMRTKKKTKFLKNITSSVIYPHSFDDGAQRRLLAFCKTDEEIEAAKAKGAIFAGSFDLIKQLQAGEMEKSEFDHVVATMDIIADLIPIRQILKEKFPNKARNTLGTDVAKLVDTVIKSHHFQSRKEEFEDESMLTLPFGKLNMPQEHLIENGRKIIDHVQGIQTVKLGNFIKEIYVLMPFSKEQFLIKKENYQREEGIVKYEAEEDVDGVSDEESATAKS